MYYAMIAGKSMKDPASHIYVFGPPATLKEAHVSAEAHYRKEHNAKPNEHVITSKIHEAETEEEMLSFMDRFANLLEEVKNVST